MNDVTQKALDGGEVFSKEYVTKLREEAKANRLKAEGLEGKAVSEKELADGRLNVALEAERKGAAKALAFEKISRLCAAAGVTIDPSQIYQEGVDPEKAFQEYVAKNESVFKAKSVEMHGVRVVDGESIKALTEGSISEVKKNPKARGLFSRMYVNLLKADRRPPK